ncbi:hypothetical protein PA7559_09480 [Pseudoalteromonas distincta]
MPKYQTDCCKFNLERSTDPRGGFIQIKVANVGRVNPISILLWKWGSKNKAAVVNFKKLDL